MNLSRPRYEWPGVFNFDSYRALQERKLGCRWRTHAEVVAGKGQFTCGAKGCNKTESLETFEVPFAYEEAGKQKQALVKASIISDALPLSTASIVHAVSVLCAPHSSWLAIRCRSASVRSMDCN